MPNARRKKSLAQHEEKKRRKGIRMKDEKNNGFGYLVPQLPSPTISKSFDPTITQADLYSIKALVPAIKSHSNNKIKDPQTSTRLPLSNKNSALTKSQNQDVTVTSSDIDLLLTNSDGYIDSTTSYKLLKQKEQEFKSSQKYKESQKHFSDSTITLQNLHSTRGIKPVVQKVSKAILTSKSIVNLEEKAYVAEFTQTSSLEVQLILNEDTVCHSDEVPTKHDDAVGNSSVQSIEDMCRICHGGEMLSNELGSLISACSCRGSVGRVHVKCLERWLTESGKNKCELCGVCYATRKIHRYGVSKSLLMWLLSQNAKQLLVDSLGIMLMSPIAVLAAWLSGRTLAGLMVQESQLLSWPLASTFVLACMTLVCYYCWIVSAATRHALDWWLWYRSQYEVKLLFQDEDGSQ